MSLGGIQDLIHLEYYKRVQKNQQKLCRFNFFVTSLPQTFLLSRFSLFCSSHQNGEGGN